MNYLQDKILKYCSQDTINNIISNNSKAVGIESNLDIINENNKNVGTILLLINSPKQKKLHLDQIVEFNADKKFWSETNVFENKSFHLINPHFVKPYSPDPKLKVPVRVLDPKSGQIVTDMMELTYNQFLKNRIVEKFEMAPHGLMLAYKNFYRLFPKNEYWFAINASVKHYRVSQDDLINIISRVNNEVKNIKNEWNTYISAHFQKVESARMIQELLDKKDSEMRSNVINFKK